MKTARWLFGLCLAGAATAWAGPGDKWTMGGYDLQNTRFNKAEITIGPGNVGKLVPKWKVATDGDVSATPLVDGDTVYFPDFAGNLYAVARDTGAIRWKSSVAAMTGVPGDHARATPALAGQLLIFGDQAGKVGGYDGYVLAVEKNTGALVWRTKVEGGFPIITQSAVVYGNVAYVGVASMEELLVRFGAPLTFRGSVYALDVRTGAVLWRTYMTPPGYTGAAVWGSTPAVDPVRKSLYVATGNNYSIPDSATACLQTAPTPESRAACLAADNFFDSVVALDLNTGRVKWASKALPDDAWNVACGIYFVPGFEDPVDGCPAQTGPDYDFGQGPTLFNAKDSNGKARDYVGAGQKSGVYWALNPDTGAVVWRTQVSPGGLAGGLQWGSAVDGRRIYAANSNAEFKQWTLQNGNWVFWGGWSALDAATGRILWETPNPSYERGMGPASVANGVVYACSMDVEGAMYALDAATGAVLWKFQSGASCNGGAAISSGMVFWGYGYDAFATDGGVKPNGERRPQGLYAFGFGAGLLRTVTVTFNVTVPATTDGTGRPVTITGTLDRVDGNLPAWDPTAVSLSRVDATHWTITLTAPEGRALEYKYTNGGWDYVEKDSACGELPNRQLTINYGTTGTLIVNDTVQNWRNVAPCGN